MLVEHRRLARGGRDVLGEHLPGRRVGDEQPSSRFGDRDGPADQPGGHRVARRPEPHA